MSEGTPEDQVVATDADDNTDVALAPEETGDDSEASTDAEGQ